MAPGADDQQAACLAGHAGEHLVRLATQHHRLCAYVGGQAAEGGAEGVPRPLPGVVWPQLAQVQGGVLALVQVTAGRHPGQQGDQGRVVLAGELGRVAQRVHAGRRPAHPREDPVCARHDRAPS
jgi:hypothetical protein